ncbi:MAG: SH3 domain-containing protein [Treponema sp.]|nr:SH3 domain-containing protein [Treponema sp.]
MQRKIRISIVVAAVIAIILSSCSRMGYGVLLWSTDSPPVDSGTVLPVYIKSNIEKIWVVGVPETVSRDRDFKMEIPLSQMEFVGSRKKANEWAVEFAPYAMVYAENLQDRLPIRSSPDNNSSQVYRLRLGEIIKILSLVNGVPPISTTGDPLPGAWYRVMTSDGVTGYCFSYRLRIFNQYDKSVQTANLRGSEPDPELDNVLSKTWSAESYLQMINSRRINIQELEKNYRFDPGFETGVARIILPDIERQFIYERIIPDGDRAWAFEGANLQMVLRNNSTLAVQFSDGDVRRTIVFNALSNSISDIVLQEEARRENQFMDIYNLGPAFTSLNYGTITFLQTGDFVWNGFALLVPQLIPYQANGTGSISMDIFIAPSLEGNNTGAFSMQFAGVSANSVIYFMYIIDDQSLRLEAVPDFAIENNIITRRAASPTVLYFYRDSPY